MVHATQFLRDDHKTIKGLFRAAENRQEIARELFMVLEIHSKVEEQIFYPEIQKAVENSAERFLQSLLEDGFKEHAEVAKMIEVLRSLEIDRANFQSRLKELQESVEQHIQKEEQELLPFVEQRLSHLLEPLFAQMQELKEKLIALPEYQSAQPENVQNPNGGEQSRKKSAA